MSFPGQPFRGQHTPLLPALLVGVCGLALGACQRAGSDSGEASSGVNSGLTRLATNDAGTVTLAELPSQPREEAPLDLAAIAQAALDLDALRAAPVEPGAPTTTPAPGNARPRAPRPGGIPRGAATEEAFVVDTGFAPTADVQAANAQWASVDPLQLTIPEPAPLPEPVPPFPPATGDAGPATGLSSLAGSIPALPAPELAPPSALTGEGAWSQGEAVSHADLVGIQLAISLAGKLRQADTSSDLTPAYAMGTLELLHPGFVRALGDEGSALRRYLPGEDAKVLMAARDQAMTRWAQIAQEEAGVGEEPEPSMLSIPAAVLCSRVQSFGKYEPLAGGTFLAGQAIRAIVYTEVDGFANKEISGGRRQVELAQALGLFADADGTEVWRRKERSVKEASRNVRRDFYLVQEIELPRTLSVGRYNLKVTVKDKASGMETSSTIPIVIVADPSLASAGARGE